MFDILAHIFSFVLLMCKIIGYVIILSSTLVTFGVIAALLRMDDPQEYESY